MNAPVDPRTSWQLPAFGGMPITADLEPLVTRVLAPNPDRMTLDGTNTYVVGAPGSGAAVLVDPGPDDPAHLAAVEAALAARGARVAAVLVTHHHGDHAEAALPWGARFGAQVMAGSGDVAGPEGRVLTGGDRLRLGRHHGGRRPHARALLGPPGVPRRVRRRPRRRPRAGPRHLGGHAPRGRRRRLPGVAAHGA
ncbi:MBL fold metallo-hydrolase [Blastococcus sp. TML/M2B]|uniref:MBL fold metallo-hydrolase n=1 Tax=Blastococcus sp. TML/M2B TaxID=2798727 RepID=UPI002814FD5B|nr:MBL fold metallo-hydrolase [Blastococcus sp. TML/M2B]